MKVKPPSMSIGGVKHKALSETTMNPATRTLLRR